ncbi:MAG: hypothetical protein AMJ79_11985 [Phycisphaerae bacterium SM23_30]|nr:MAG: hypothetical protein AMJ79_11985 [Phycisphaerae bacterium SM23_30]
MFGTVFAAIKKYSHKSLIHRDLDHFAGEFVEVIEKIYQNDRKKCIFDQIRHIITNPKPFGLEAATRRER